MEDGNLIHSLEHGYVIIWYNCGQLADDECADLKRDVRELVRFSGAKVIGVPREGMESILAVTSWGWLDRMDEFDARRIKAFIEKHRSRPPAPEPNAP